MPDNPLISLDNLSRFKGKMKTEIEAKYGVNSGVATLDSSGKLTSGQIPASTLNVEEYASSSAFPQTGSTKRIYIDKATNNLYRWNGSAYVNVSSPESVKYIQQTLNANQKTQARTNIGAAAASDVSTINGTISDIQAALQQMQDNVSDVARTEDGIRIDYANGTSKEIEIDFDFPIKSIVYDENFFLHFYDDNDTDLFDPVYIQGGGGSGGAVGSVKITRLTNESVDCVYGNPLSIQYSIEAKDSSDDFATLKGSTWSVDGVVVARNIEVSHGNNAFDIGPYLNIGTNTVKVTVTADTGGDVDLTASKTWRVNAVNMRFEWDYDDTQINTSAFTDTWTVYGDVEKTSHTKLDGTELATVVTTKTGATQSIRISMLSHGAHSVERWLTATIGDISQRTDSQYHEMIFVEQGNSTPIIAISMKEISMNQYDTVRIPIVAYNPASITADATLYLDGTEIGTWDNVDRSVQYWSYTPVTSGSHTLTVQCGETTKSIQATVQAVDLDIEEVEGYTFRFKSSDFASNNAVRAWNSNGITASFSENFDWVNGGLHTEEDADGNLQQYFCIKSGTRMTINHKLFATDPKARGMTFKMIYKVCNCRDYDAEVANCYSDVGLRFYAHNAIFNSSGTTISVPYGEDEYTELEFDTYPVNGFRYMMAWMDGVITTCRVYDANDSFVHPVGSQQNLIIGSDDCDIYIYMIKFYPMVVSRDAHINNFIMDAPNATEMAKRYNRNNILNEGGEIDYNRLVRQNPDCRVWLYDIPYMTNDKSDKVGGCKFNQFWGNGDQYYQMSGEGKMSIQGTSSVTYMRGCANTDINFTKLEDGNGINLLANGVKDDDYGGNWFVEDENNIGHAKVFVVQEDEVLGPECVPVERNNQGSVTKYVKALGLKLNDNSCPITYSNTKVNFASCEQVNNMCNAAWYQRFNPYPSLTKRDCMEFNMGVQFMKDTGDVPDDSHFVLFGDGKYHMYSIANMGNSKKNVHVLHDLSNPNEVCIEVNDNNAVQMRMVNPDNLSYQDYFAAETWDGKKYYGMRYPDTKNPSSDVVNAWYRLVWWMVNSDPNAHTDQPLANAETYAPYTFRGHDRAGLQVLRGTTVSQYAGTYTHDTFERRMAKMLSECEDYMVMDSFIYHYLYLERHTMVDNVSKNNFWSSTDLLHWDLSKAYDMDTSDGNNNQGQLVFDYGNEWNDRNERDGKMVFNGGDSVWFVFCANLYEACQTMFTNRETAGAWSASAYHNFLLSEQRKVPERCWNQCYWYDYIRTYEEGISDEWMTFLDGGQKTHQRKHYEYFQELYDASKYRGSASTSYNVNFRAYKPVEWAGVQPKSQITITMYNKMYIALNAGTTAMTPIKAQRNVPYVINFPVDVDVGGTQIVIYTAPMIQAISGMEQLYPDTCVFSMATRLRNLKIGSTVSGYQNTNLRNIALGNNKMLERLEVQNLPNANSILDLSNCPALEYLDATGSGFTAYSFADGGLLEEAIINRPTSLSMINLSKIEDENFTINDYSGLISLRIENVPDVDSYALVNYAVNLQIARLIGIDWLMTNANTLNRLLTLQGMNENNITVPQSVLAGDAYAPSMRQRNLNQYAVAWPNLNVTYDNIVEEFQITFSNPDGTPIKDRLGNNYIQYVDRGQSIEDPVTNGYIDTPTMESTAQYNYTFNGWQNITGPVMDTRNVIASYESSVRTYRVRWYAQTGALLKTVYTEYGTEVKFEDNEHTFPPVKTDEEENLYFWVFKNWDKSTGFVTENIDVYAVWDRAPLPTAGSKNLKDMSIAEIYGIAKTYRAPEYFEDEDYVDIQVGKDFNFSNVQSQVLLSERYFNGNEIYRLNNINLFAEDAPSFTLAIDYEYCGDTTNATLISCCDTDGGTEGFRVHYYRSGNTYEDHSIRVLWGDRTETVGHGQNRGMLVLRHKKGSNNLLIASSNDGRYVYHANGYGGDEGVDDYKYDAYNAELVYTEIPRAQQTTGNCVLSFGAAAYGTQGMSAPAKGWIHWAKIWYDDLGGNVVRQLACWPHETWRMHYRGSGLYNKDDGTGLLDGASFIANAPLPQFYEMYPETQGNTAGSWKNSILRSFTNTRCFNALPFEWQSIIKPVRIVTKGGADNPDNLEYTTDKIYIPSYADMTSSTISLISSEGTQISWFTNNASRVKFMGINTPDNAQIVTLPNDPTLYTDTYTIKDGDIWIRSNDTSKCYVYVNATTAARHGYYGGREIDNTNNVAASGAQGGLWIRSVTYWTRTNTTNTNYTFQYTVYPNGAPTSTYVGSSDYQRRGVVLMFSL